MQLHVFDICTSNERFRRECFLFRVRLTREMVDEDECEWQHLLDCQLHRCHGQ